MHDAYSMIKKISMEICDFANNETAGDDLRHSAIEKTVNTEKFNCLVSFEEKKPEAGATEMLVHAKIEEGSTGEGSLSLQLEICGWDRECYLLMPAAAYSGNRFKAVKCEYPPSLRNMDGAGRGMETLITDVPRLEIDSGKSEIELLANDLSTPCVGIHSSRKKAGLLIYMEGVTEKGYTGICFNEKTESGKAHVKISFPGKRKHMYTMCDRDTRSDDKGVELKAGDEFCTRLLTYEFQCPDVPSLFKKFNETVNRLVPMGNPPRTMPFSKAFELIENKYNKMNWDDKEKFYTVDTENRLYGSWQAGWVGGGINSYCMMAEGVGLSKERALQTLDFIFGKMQNEKGFFHTVSKDGKVYGDDFENPEDADYILLRKNADMAYFLFKQLFLLRKRGSGETAGRYGTGLRKFCDALLCFWDRHGGFGQFIDMRNEEIVLGGTASAGILPATLVLAYRFFGDSRYLDAACEAAKGYYEDYTKKGLTNGGPSEIGQCPDSESAFALLESFVVLYENTNDVKWLEMSKDAAYQALSWVVSYRFDFPESSEFGRLGVDTTGSVFANVQNKHSAPGICTLSGDSLLKLYRHTGDEMFMDRLEKIAGGITQYLSREGRIIHSWDGRPLPQGFINERVNMSDWEGKDRIGGVFYGSCWSEVSCMLSYNELPGVYVDKERGKAWALDNVVVEFVGDDKIEIENPTEYDARLKIYVDCPVKKTLHENFFPIFKRR